VKGIEVIFDALAYVDRCLPVEISLLGPGWDSDYGKQLWKRVSRDRRVIAPRVINPNDMLYELAKNDACLVPSLVLETGPLAVYEALAAGIPIIGSRLGGIADRVRDNIDGLLFAPGDARALANIIQAILDSPEKLDRLRQNIQPQRTFDEMARELELLYEPIKR
jgi:glycosyltransferase involved in cell wall biosynthesis